jgi:hypothetical protein
MAIKLRDPVHNFITLRGDEVRLMDTAAIQRLRGIRQLAFASLVYPGAVHTRFDHSIGVAHVAGLMAEALDLEPEEISLVRLAALLHDVGHGPFSHVSEHALEVFADRSTLSQGQKRDKIHELISARIIETNPEITKILGQDKCRDIARLLSEGHGQPALKSIVSGPLDADKQDYLLRDSLFCGVPYGVFDIHQMQRSLTLRGPEDEKQLMIKPDGIHAIEQYVLAKYYLTTNVYRHKVRLITDQMIVRAIMLGIEKDNIQNLAALYRFDNKDNFVENYCRWDDSRFLLEFSDSRTKCGELLCRLRSRRLLKRVLDARVNDFKPEVKDRLNQVSLLENRTVRQKLEAAIAEKLSSLLNQQIDPDFVIVNVFSIRSVKETSRNEESGILVARDTPRPFTQESTLFNSINEQYADESVEVYAPVSWPTNAEKSRIRRLVRGPVIELIESICNWPQEAEGTAQ